MTVLPFSIPRSASGQNRARSVTCAGVRDRASGHRRHSPQGIIHHHQIRSSETNIVVVGIQYRTPSPLPLPTTGNSAGEDCADYCCNFSGSFSARGISRVPNFCRPLTGWSFRALLKPSKQSCSRVVQAFRNLRVFAALFHEQTMKHGAERWNEKAFPNPTTVLPRMK